ASGYRMEIEGLGEAVLPCVIFWEFNHFLVLEGFRGNRAYLNDPAHGRRTVSAEEFDRSFSGVVLALKPGAEFKKGGEKPTATRALRRKLRGARVGLGFCVLAGLGLAIPGLVIPTLTKIFVDQVLIGGSARWLGPLVAGLLAAALMRGALTALERHHLMRASTKLAISATGRFLWRVLRLPIGFFAQRYAGDISSRIAGNQRVALALTGDLAASLIGLITLVFYAALMLRYDIALTVIGIGLSMLNLLLLRTIARKRADESQRMLQESGKLMAVAMGGVQMIETIKSSARESDFFSRWAGHQAKASIAEQRLASSSAMLETAPVCLSAVSTALVLGVGGLRVMDGALTIGMLVAFQSLLVNFNRPINELVRMGGVIQRLTGDLRRLEDVENHPIDLSIDREAEKDQSAAAPTRRLSGFLELKNVTFGYNRLDEPLLRDFSLR
ncbi:MAG: ABC transporter transmembrane domain-containing protein, partial [Planctomycetota bacterium]|nr:ABC transporter transmembrane domain-containing protein [Planctomycetota bacterium]